MGPYVMRESVWKYGNAEPYNISNASANLFFGPEDIYVYVLHCSFLWWIVRLAVWMSSQQHEQYNVVQLITMYK